MKIRFVQHTAILPKSFSTRFRYITNHFHREWAGWCTWDCGKKEVEEIVIVKQRNILKTSQIFIHELAHAVAYKIFGVKKWHEQLIHRYL